MTILSLNKVIRPTPRVSLNVITAVINKTNNEILWIIFELFFLKTPRISKNIIDNEIKISGNINSILFIVYLPHWSYMYRLNHLLKLQ